MNRRHFLGASAMTGIALVSPKSALSSDKKAQVCNLDFAPDINEIRELAKAIPGNLPTGINATKVADTIRPASVVVRGESPDRNMTLVRTVYQLIYPTGTVMIDSSMDKATFMYFGKGGKNIDPFYDQNYRMVTSALLNAELIVLSHYHGDHVGGVIRSEKFDELAHKVWVSEDTADLLITKPHKPTLKISQENVEKFIVSDFRKYYPIAPGLVALKSPGHTPDSKMFYIKQQNGREFIHSVDAGWSLENIVKGQMKNASWLKEDEKQLSVEYQWLNQIMAKEENLTVVTSHDALQYNELIEKGIFGNKLAV